jgi:hypothetical protein
MFKLTVIQFTRKKEQFLDKLRESGQQEFVSWLNSVSTQSRTRWRLSTEKIF